MEVVDIVSDVRQCLFTAFHEWIKHHRSLIGENWFGRLLDQEKKAWEDCSDTVKLIGTALWMFNTISQFGVLAGLGPNNVNLQHIPEGVDERRTRRLLLWCSSCLGLQTLPREVIKQEIPDKKGPPWRFRLTEYIQAQR